MPLSPNADFFLAVAEETRDSLSDSAFTGEFEKLLTLNDTNSIWKTDTQAIVWVNKGVSYKGDKKNAQQVVCGFVVASRMVKFNYILHNVLKNIEKLVWVYWNICNYE